VTDTVLVIGATARLTRAVVADDIGWWYVREPAFRWAEYDPEAEEGPTGNRQRLVSGLDCPHCVGFWIGVGVLAMTAVAPRGTRRGTAWRWGMAALGLNTAVTVVGGQLEYFG